MSLALSATIVYAIVILYLVARSVEWPLIGKIVLAGLGGGLALSLTLGVAYFLIVLLKPVETFCVFAMISVVGSAAYFARERILQTITPLGIIFLNVAANLAPAQGPLPLSLAWLAAWIPLPYGPARVFFNLLVLYLPSIAALWLLRRGPPGGTMLRYALGVWTVYVGIAAIVGPGWHLIADFRVDDPARWVASGFAAYAAMHVVMLALNLLISISDDTGEGAASIARSVRVDRMHPLQALAFGAAFWLSVHLFLRVPIRDYDLKAAAIIAAAFALGTALAGFKPPAGAEADDAPRGAKSSLALTARLLVVVAVFGGFMLWIWRNSSPEVVSASRMNMSTATGTQLKHAPGMVLAYQEAHLHARLKEALAREGVPYSTFVTGGREYLKVAEEHRKGVERARFSIEGPDLPNYRNAQFRDPAREKQFTDWLTAKGVKWERVRKRDQDHIVWEPVHRHTLLMRAFDDSRQLPWLGVDYHAMYVIGEFDPFEPAITRVAAFETEAHRERFIAWLRERGVTPQVVQRNGATFVTWQSDEPHLLAQYRSQMHTQCIRQWQAKAKAAEPAVVPNPC